MRIFERFDHSSAREPPGGRASTRPCSASGLRGLAVSLDGPPPASAILIAGRLAVTARP